MLSDSVRRVNRSLRAGLFFVLFCLFALPLPASHWAQGNPDTEEFNWACLFLPDRKDFFFFPTHRLIWESSSPTQPPTHTARRRHRHLSTAIELSLGRWNTLQLPHSSRCSFTLEEDCVNEYIRYKYLQCIIYLYSIISDYSLYLLEMCNILLQIHVFAALLVNVTFLMCIVQFSFFPPSRCFKCVSMNCAYVCSISLRYISCAKMRLSTWGQHCTGVILKADQWWRR